MCSVTAGAKNLCSQLRTSTRVIRVQLLLRWNIYLLCNSDVVKTGRITVNFCHLVMSWSSVGEGWQGQKGSFTFSLLVLLKEMRTLSQLRFHLIVLVWIKRIRRQGESKILFCNPNGGKILVRTSECYKNLLGWVPFRVLPTPTM